MSFLDKLASSGLLKDLNQGLDLQSNVNICISHLFNWGKDDKNKNKFEKQQKRTIL